MSEFELKYKPYGERSILIEWPQIISEKTLNDVVFYRRKLEHQSVEEKVYIKSAYNSILITYEYTINNIYDKISALKSVYSDDFDGVITDSKLWKIPVCYDFEFGLDLEEISLKNNLEISKIIELHTKVNYLVYFIGFLPGFLYLGGLEKRLHFPRKNTPRLHVKKGSVAIGGSQTGIYPNESPGGWNIIGSTPLNFFDVHNQSPCFAKSGDRIQFVQISMDEFNKITAQVDNGNYNIESEVIND
ncbi:MAG: 5-oxoprolinase subunit PxpB [Flavobacteriaceae bacterium]|nr:5-oxoprolinase subunit PxpB [Flavobacteriaceae bacterium]